MPKVAALVDAHSLRAFVVIPKACSSLGLVHPATTTFISFSILVSCTVPVLFLFFCGGGHGVQSLHSTRRLYTHPPWVLYTELVARCIFIWASLLLMGTN